MQWVGRVERDGGGVNRVTAQWDRIAISRSRLATYRTTLIDKLRNGRLIVLVSVRTTLPQDI